MPTATEVRTIINGFSEVITTTIDIPDGLSMREQKKLIWEEQQRVQTEHAKEQRLSEKRNEENRLAIRRQELQDNPFDPRTGVSADAKHITKTIWTIFVLLPVVFGILFGIIAAANH